MVEFDYTVCPGDYIHEYMEDNNLSPVDMAAAIGCWLTEILGILDGTTPLTQEMAEKISAITAIPADALMRYETAFVEDLARLGRTRDEEAARY